MLNVILNECLKAFLRNVRNRREEYRRVRESKVPSTERFLHEFDVSQFNVL